MRAGALVQVDPAGPTVRFKLNPTTMRFSGRGKRIEVISRPGRIDAAEWDGSALRRVEFRLRLDGWPARSVSGDILTLERMAGLSRPSAPPPQVQLDYGGLLATRFVIESISRGPELRRDDLQVVRIDMDIALLEWVTPTLVAAPAVREQQRQQTAAAASDRPATVTGQTHTVTSGDTLWALATRFLGDGSRWQEIADANGVRDPRSLAVGQTLRIPNR